MPPTPGAPRTTTRVPIRRHLAELAITATSFVLVAWILPSITMEDWWDAIAAALFVSIANAIIWPLFARWFSLLILWTAGLLGIAANAAIIVLAGEIIDGLEVSSWWGAVITSVAITAVAIVLSTMLAVDDDTVFRRQTIRRMVARLDPAEPTDVPGILFLQIDGLAEPILRRAVADGHAPTLARWLRTGTHRIVRWECDLSSQTGASQAGILHGNNENMPAFRWYDKELGRVLTSNRPRDAAVIEQRQSDGHGLLADGGTSRSNVFSGDSTDSVFTFSTLLDRSRHSRHTAHYIFSDPYAISRLLVLSFADVMREIADRRRARKRGIEPRLPRRGVYPIARAATTTILRDLTIYTLMSDVYRGVPVAYADFVGYDEVAHHSGIGAATALDTLGRLDEQLSRLEQVIAEAPRPYHVVVLSDHGQTQGATFLQRYGLTLEQLIDSLVAEGTEIHAPQTPSEGWGNLNGALTEAAQDESSRLGALIRTATRSHTVDGDIVLGPSYLDDVAAASGSDDTANIVVLASGNLGIVWFTDIAGRADLETIASRHPGLVAGIAQHPGVGFVMVRSAELGAVVIGGAGVRYLSDDRVEGVDPLEHFGPNAADHLRRTDSFVNAPDILVNSFFDPHADEGAAFEELIGFHGGLGGEQTMPFVLHPSTFTVPDQPLVGAAAIHHLFKGWLEEMRAPDATPPWSTPTTPPTVMPSVPT